MAWIREFSCRNPHNRKTKPPSPPLRNPLSPHDSPRIDGVAGNSLLLLSPHLFAAVQAATEAVSPSADVEHGSFSSPHATPPPKRPNPTGKSSTAAKVGMSLQMCGLVSNIYVLSLVSNRHCVGRKVPVAASAWHLQVNIVGGKGVQMFFFSAKLNRDMAFSCLVPHTAK